MSRKSRRLHVRLVRAAAVAASTVFIYQRWQLRSFGVYPASAYRAPSLSSSTTSSSSTAPEAADLQPSTTATRSDRWSNLQSSSTEKPFDVLVVGGGLTGLYTAVDAAQRGLRVALVDAADIGGGSTTSAMPTVSPGAFPYVQRSIRQRDAGWLRVARTTMEEETTWKNVAAPCVIAPATIDQRVRTGFARMRSYFRRDDDLIRGGSPRAGVSPRPARTLLPALHLSEMLEYVCAAAISTALSVFCGPVRPVSVLSASAVERRLPALSPRVSSSNTSAVRAKGGVVTNNVIIEGSAAAVALASTAEQLGVVLCTYAPVVRLQEEVTKLLDVKCGSSATEQNKQQQRKGRTSWWLLGRSTGPASMLKPSRLMVAQIRDAFATGSDVDPHNNNRKAPASTSTPFLARWFAPRTTTTDLTKVTPTSTAHTDNAHAQVKTTTSPTSSTAVVYARSVVNCGGCDVDIVKALFDSNASDAVPAAFAGCLAYSYLVAPADAVSASAAAASSSSHGHNSSTDGPKAVQTSQESHLLSPFTQMMRVTGLHFSSPRLSFASTMVLPWWDRCVLLGPCISPLPHLHSSESAGASSFQTVPFGAFLHRAHGYPVSTLDGAYVIQSKDGYAAQREQILSMLASCGVTVDTSRLLSCVSQIVPFVKSSKEAPFQAELLDKGYALRFSSVPLQDDGSSPSFTVKEGSQVGEKDRRDVAFLHVYGGTPVLARRIAEDVVNALVHHPSVFNAERVNQLHPCRTRHLQLTVPPSLLQYSGESSSSRSPPGKTNAVSRLQPLILDSYAERLVDMIARRTHVAYTSPGDALHALPLIAGVMSELKGWSKERTDAEMEAARRLVASVVVATPRAGL